MKTKMKILTLTLLSSLMIMKTEAMDDTPVLTYKEKLALRKKQIAEEQLSQSQLSQSMNLGSSTLNPDLSQSFLGSSLLGSGISTPPESKLMAELEAKDQEIGKLKLHVAKFEHSLEQAEEDYRLLQKAEGEQRKFIEQKEREIEGLQQDLEAAKKQLKANKKEIERLEAEVAHHKSTASSGSLSGSMVMPSSPSKSSVQLAERTRQENLKLQQQISDLELEVQGKLAELSDAEDEIEILNEKLKQAGEALDAEKEDSKQAVENIKKQAHQDIEKQKQTYEKEASDRELLISQLKASASSSADVSEAQRLQAEAEKALEEKSENFDLLTSAFDQLQKEKKAVDELIFQAEKERDETKELLQRAQEGYKTLLEQKQEGEKLSQENEVKLNEEIRLAGEKVKELAEKLRLATELADTLTEQLRVQKEAHDLQVQNLTKQLDEETDMHKKTEEESKQEYAKQLKEAQENFDLQIDDVKRLAVEAREKELMIEFNKQLEEAKVEAAREREEQLMKQFKEEAANQKKALALGIVDLLTPLRYLASVDAPKDRMDVMAALDDTPIPGSKGPEITLKLTDFLQNLLKETGVDENNMDDFLNGTGEFAV